MLGFVGRAGVGADLSEAYIRNLYLELTALLLFFFFLVVCGEGNGDESRV